MHKTLALFGSPSLHSHVQRNRTRNWRRYAILDPLAARFSSFHWFSAQGLGRAIALRLADDGFDVAVNDLPAQADNLLEVVKEIQAKGGSSSLHLADVTVEEQVKAAIAEVAQVYDGIDVVGSLT